MHAEKVPQRHTPLAQRSVRVVSQAAQAAPFAPQVLVFSLAWGTQTLPEQQPEHTVLSHLQPVVVQWRLAEQAAFPLQVQLPELQVLVVPEQVPHAAPPLPHWLAVSDVSGTQVLPRQQPPQLVELQTQAPLTHCWPLPQVAPPPQWQAPSLPQLSELSGLQAVHAAPLVPQLLTVPGLTQVLPLQQPVGQVDALQTHWPFMHSWPAPQGALLPHLHVPLLLQVSAEVLEQVVQVLPN